MLKLAAGLKMADLFSEKQAIRRNAGNAIESREKRKIEAVYNYVSINGEYAYTKIRALKVAENAFRNA